MRRRSAQLAIGIDIGGTDIKYGILRGKQILQKGSVPTAPVASDPRKVQDRLVELIVPLLRKQRGRKIPVGIGIPGLVRFPQGVVNGCANLPGWADTPLRQNMQRRLQTDVRVDNDVHVMTLAEWKYGAGRGAENFICLTLGTGVGGGLVLNNKLYRGRRGSVGEIGHLPVARRGPACGCGGQACLERYVGNKEILRAVKRRLRSGKRSRIRSLVKGNLSLVTHRTIDQACAQKDPLAQQTWAQAGTLLGQALAATANLLDPERIVVGGGVAKAGQWIFQPMRRSYKERVIEHLRDTPIVPAHLGTSAGLIGAGLLACGFGDKPAQ